MKKWSAPVIEEMNIADTQYGGKSSIDFDDIYVNSEGKWEGTFKES